MLREQELGTVDLRFDVRGATDPPDDVVVVAMDQRTLDADPNVGRPVQPPPPRARDRAPDRGRRAGDRLRRPVHRAELVPGSRRRADRGGARARGASSSRPPRSRSTARRRSSAAERRWSTAGPRRPTRTSSSTRTACCDGCASSSERLETLAMAAARLQTGRPIDTDGARDAWIDYPGPPGTIDTLSFADVEYGRFAPAAVRGKVVVVGATARVVRGPARDLRRRRHAGAGGARRRHRHGARRVRARRGAGLGRLAAARGARRGGAAGRGALRHGDGPRSPGWWRSRSSSSAPSSPSERGVIVAVLPPLAAALTGIVGALLLANPVSHPWVNRVLDAVSRHGALNHRTRRLRALLLIGTALSVAAAALLLEATNALRGLELEHRRPAVRRARGRAAAGERRARRRRRQDLHAARRGHSGRSTGGCTRA